MKERLDGAGDDRGERITLKVESLLRLSREGFKETYPMLLDKLSWARSAFDILCMAPLQEARDRVGPLLSDSRHERVLLGFALSERIWRTQSVLCQRIGSGIAHHYGAAPHRELADARYRERRAGRCALFYHRSAQSLRLVAMHEMEQGRFAVGRGLLDEVVRSTPGSAAAHEAQRLLASPGLSADPERQLLGLPSPGELERLLRKYPDLIGAEQFLRAQLDLAIVAADSEYLSAITKCFAASPSGQRAIAAAYTPQVWAALSRVLSSADLATLVERFPERREGVLQSLAAAFEVVEEGRSQLAAALLAVHGGLAPPKVLDPVAGCLGRLDAEHVPAAVELFAVTPGGVEHPAVEDLLSAAVEVLPDLDAEGRARLLVHARRLNPSRAIGMLACWLEAEPTADWPQRLLEGLAAATPLGAERLWAAAGQVLQAAAEAGDDAPLRTLAPFAGEGTSVQPAWWAALEIWLAQPPSAGRFATLKTLLTAVPDGLRPQLAPQAEAWGARWIASLVEPIGEPGRPARDLSAPVASVKSAAEALGSNDQALVAALEQALAQRAQANGDTPAELELVLDLRDGVLGLRGAEFEAALDARIERMSRGRHRAAAEQALVSLLEPGAPGPRADLLRRLRGRRTRRILWGLLSVALLAGGAAAFALR